MGVEEGQATKKRFDEKMERGCEGERRMVSGVARGG